MLKEDSGIIRQHRVLKANSARESHYSNRAAERSKVLDLAMSEISDKRRGFMKRNLKRLSLEEIVGKTGRVYA